MTFFQSMLCGLAISICLLSAQTGCGPDLSDPGPGGHGLAGTWGDGSSKADWVGLCDGNFILENELEQATTSCLLEGYRKQGMPQWLSGKGAGPQPSVPIHFVKFPPFRNQEIKGAIVILPGRAECHAKYMELIYDLSAFRHAGYAIYSMDHRGQGFSGRLLGDDSEKGYVDDFLFYLEDVWALVDLIRGEMNDIEGNKKLFGIGHSMGGAILAMSEMKAAEDPRRARNFDAIALSAPMLEINFDSLSESVAYNLARSTVVTGFGDSYAPGEGPYQEGQLVENSPYTTSPARFQMTKFIFEDPRAYPHTRLGGVTYKWVAEAVEADRWIRSHPQFLKTPTFLAVADLDETVISQSAQTFCAQVASGVCNHQTFSPSKHELLMEQDHIRQAVIQQITSFFVDAHDAF